METIIEFNNKEKQRLCRLLEQLEEVVRGPLKQNVRQSRKIYCDVKKGDVITITGDNITKLQRLLMEAAAIDDFENDAMKLYELIESKERVKYVR